MNCKPARSELSQSVEELRALGEVTQAVNSTLDVELALTTIVAKAVQLSGTEAGTIYVFDEAGQEFRMRASYGMDDAHDRGDQGPPHPHGRDGGEPCGAAAQAGADL